MSSLELYRLEGDELETPPTIKNTLVRYYSPLYGKEIEAPLLSNEPIFLDGDDDDEYLLLGEDEDTGYLVYGFEDDETGDAVLIYGDEDGNVLEYSVLDGFKMKGFGKGFKIKAPKIKLKAPKLKLPKLKMKMKMPKLNTKGLSKSFSSATKGISKSVTSVTKGLSKAGQSVAKGVGDHFKTMGRNLSEIAEGAGNLVSQVAQGAGGLLSNMMPGGGGMEEGYSEEEEEEEYYDEEYPTEEELYEEEQYYDEEYPEDYSEEPTYIEEYEEEEMYGEAPAGEALGFIEFLPMAMNTISQVSNIQKQQLAAKSAKKKQNQQQLLKLLNINKQAPVKVTKPTARKPSVIKIPRPVAPAVTQRSYEAKGGDQSKPDNTKMYLALGGFAVVGIGAVFLLNNNKKKR